MNKKIYFILLFIFMSVVLPLYGYEPNQCTRCILGNRPDILDHYKKVAGWDISPWNWNAIIEDWCNKLDKPGCALEKQKCWDSCNPVPTPCTECILGYRPDILSNFGSWGWETSVENYNGIIVHWCGWMDPTGCNLTKQKCGGSCGVVPTCPYDSVQARVQKDDADPWKRSMSIYLGESFRVGAFQNGWDKFAENVSITLSGPNGFSVSPANVSYVTPPYSGEYTLLVVCGNLQEAATITVAGITPPPDPCTQCILEKHPELLGPQSWTAIRANAPKDYNQIVKDWCEANSLICAQDQQECGSICDPVDPVACKNCMSFEFDKYEATCSGTTSCAFDCEGLSFDDCCRKYPAQCAYAKRQCGQICGAAPPVAGLMLVNNSGIQFKQIDVGDQDDVWGVDTSNNVYQLKSDNTWEKANIQLKQISVGSDGSVWGINGSGEVFERVNGAWSKFKAKKFKQISVWDKNIVWGVDDDNNIHKLAKSWWNDRDWTQLNDSKNWKQVAVESNGVVWAIALNGDVYRWYRDVWEKVRNPVKLNQISAGNRGHVWGTRAFDLYFGNFLTKHQVTYFWTGAVWQPIHTETQLKYIAVVKHADPVIYGEFWGIGVDGNIYKMIIEENPKQSELKRLATFLNFYDVIWEDSDWRNFNSACKLWDPFDKDLNVEICFEWAEKEDPPGSGVTKLVKEGTGCRPCQTYTSLLWYLSGVTNMDPRPHKTIEEWFCESGAGTAWTNVPGFHKYISKNYPYLIGIESGTSKISGTCNKDEINEHCEGLPDNATKKQFESTLHVGDIVQYHGTLTGEAPRYKHSVIVVGFRNADNKPLVASLGDPQNSEFPWDQIFNTGCCHNFDYQTVRAIHMPVYPLFYKFPSACLQACPITAAVDAGNRGLFKAQATAMNTQEDDDVFNAQTGQTLLFQSGAVNMGDLEADQGVDARWLVNGVIVKMETFVEMKPYSEYASSLSWTFRDAGQYQVVYEINIDKKANDDTGDDDRAFKTVLVTDAGLVDAAQFVHETYPDNTPVPGGTTFTKAWTIRNTGTTTWNSAYQLKYLSGGLSTSHVTLSISGMVAPNQEYTFYVPMKAPLAQNTNKTYREDWSFTTPAGGQLLPLWAQIVVPAGLVDGAKLDWENYPNNTPVKGGTAFTKTWKIKNTGTTTWNSGYKLRHVSGNLSSDHYDITIPYAVAPNRTYSFYVSMKAPAAQNTDKTYREEWKLINPTENTLLPLWTQIVVPAALVDGAELNHESPAPKASIKGGTTFAKSWKIKNTGTTTWNNGYKLKYLNGGLSTKQTTLSIAGTVAPGRQYTFKVPMRAPVTRNIDKFYLEEWHFVNPDGKRLLLLNANIKVPAGTDIAKLDWENYPANTFVPGNTTFTKAWKIKNTGTATWNSGYKLRHVRGNLSSDRYDIIIPYDIAPKQTYSFYVSMNAPAIQSTNQTCTEQWKFINQNDKQLLLLQVSIVVKGKSKPNAPTDPVVTPLNTTSMQFSWKDNSDNENGFRIVSGNKEIWKNANTASHVMTGLTSGQEVCFQVQSYNEIGYSALTTKKCAKTYSIPNAPTNFKAVALDNARIKLTWNDNSNNETGFRIRNGANKKQTTGANTSYYIWTGLAPGQSMCFQVQSYNAYGSSDWSDSRCATTKKVD